MDTQILYQIYWLTSNFCHNIYKWWLTNISHTNCR